MAEPTNYDKLQDGRLDSLESLTSAEYQPPAGVEYSYPVANQGITQEQFRTMMRAAGTGTFVQHDPGGSQSAYLLVGMPGGGSETNANNQMILKVASTTGRNEAVIDGFFHAQTQDMVIDFPPVTTPTTYYLCLTYDPRREEEPQGPIHVEVHTNDLPSTHGRKHIVLWTVEREPNQLLTQARIQHSLSWVSPVLSVFDPSQLPDPSSVVYGTIGVAIHGAGDNSPTIYASRGHHGWLKTSDGPVGEWVAFDGRGGWTVNNARARHTPMGIQLAGYLTNPNSTSNTRFAQLSEGYRPNYTFRGSAQISSSNSSVRLEVSADGYMTYSISTSTTPTNICLDGVIIPINADR